MKIENTKKRIELSQGAFVFVPAVIRTTCPQCEEEETYDMSTVENALINPKTNQPFAYFMDCDECGCEWSVDLILFVTLGNAAHHPNLLEVDS
jgi:hypothetical protein